VPTSPEPCIEMIKSGKKEKVYVCKRKNGMGKKEKRKES
jgi:hypothetical protein